MTDDPLKHTPACELDRDNRAMSGRKPEALIGVFIRQLNAALADENAALLVDNERLKAIERAAEKAYRYHMLGYKDATEFNANVMLDLMNELGELL